MIRALDVLTQHPEHRITTLDHFICFQLEHAPDGLTALSLVELTGASMRYLDARLTALTRASIVQRSRRTSKSGRPVTIFTLGDPGGGLRNPLATSGEGSASQTVSPRKLETPGQLEALPAGEDL